MSTVAHGQSVTLVAEFYEYPGGPAADVTGLTVTIKTADAVTTVLGPTSSGVVHAATGVYSYVWSVGVAQTAGDYLVIWNATDSQGDAVQATELVTVTSPGGSTGRTTGIWYCTREQVKNALDAKETARSNAQVDRAIESVSREVESCLHRRFFPQFDTRYFDWPNGQSARPWRLWLDANEVISVTSLTSGDAVVPSGDYLLEPANSGPPYNRIELNLGSSAAFSSRDTHQRAIAVTGLFGYTADEEPAGTVTEALDASETGVEVSNSAAVGVGDILLVDSERMLVRGRSMADTGQNLAANLDASNAAVTVAVADGTSFAAGEVLLVDAERMLVVDIAGNNLIVKRAWDGSVLAAHSSGTDVFASRSLLVQRGALGTVAASHDTAAPIHRHLVPGPVRDLTVALALNQVLQEGSGYARVSGSGDNAQEFTGRGLASIRQDAYAACGRKVRMRSV